MEGGAVLAAVAESQRDCLGREQVQMVHRSCPLLEAQEMGDQQEQVEVLVGVPRWG